MSELTEMPYPPDMRWTLERWGANYVIVVVTTAGEVLRASVDRERVAADHPLVVELLAEWAPPRRYLPSSPGILSDAVAIYDRQLTDAEFEAHAAAVRGQG